ncbi:MAG TPA: hypothetical protein VEV38_05840, partial [Candidatus Eremiobacteraceae bacterium]|nr:hypothetical protein [Candidatus Eremiobacteraceae bacterium]
MIANLALFRRLARLAAIAAAGIGALALVGWTQGALWLTSVVPGYVPMKPNTSACVIALALAVGIQGLWRSSKLAKIGARIIALACAVIAILTIGEYLFGWHLAIDQWLMLDQTNSGIPGRMGTNTAVSLALLGIGIALEASSVDIIILRGHIVTLGAAIVALFTLVGYMYSAKYLYQVASTTPMAMNTAIAILLLCGAILWSKPERGLMGAVHSADGAGLMLRSMIPWAVVIPVVLGWVALGGERAGLYDTTYGVALFVLSTIAIFAVLIALNSRSVRALDATRSRAQNDLQEAFFSVERRVTERTQELNDA